MVDIFKILNVAKLNIDPAQVQLAIKFLPILVILLVVTVLAKHTINHFKLKPEQKRKEFDVHADIVGVLEKIYLAYYRKGHKLEKRYPKKADVHVTDTRGLNAWKISARSDSHLKQGDIGRITIHRYSVWRHEDRARISALIAAWWFNLYFYALEGKQTAPLRYTLNITKLGTIRRICLDTLKIAGLGYLANTVSKGNIDLTHLLTKKERIEHEHRDIAHIEHEEIEKVKALAQKEEIAFGKAEDIHKVAKSKIRHIQDIIHLGKKELALLKKDLHIRKEIGTEKTRNDYEALLRDILRLEIIVTWLQTNVNVGRQDKEKQKELRQKLDEFEHIILDVSSRLPHMDMILEKGTALRPVSQAEFY
ncbi:hypothetical protein ACFL3V_02780 [Nanoarchaeota archaeon]